MDTDEEVYGFTRKAILSKDWHKDNPNVARHLFGFPSRKELVYTLHVLFNAMSPKIIPTKKTQISLFEKYLMGYLRIHSRMSVQSIAYIRGKKNGHVGRLITNTAKHIGDAGIDLSILDITSDFLESTCPQK